MCPFFFSACSDVAAVASHRNKDGVLPARLIPLPLPGFAIMKDARRDETVKRATKNYTWRFCIKTTVHPPFFQKQSLQLHSTHDEHLSAPILVSSGANACELYARFRSPTDRRLSREILHFTCRAPHGNPLGYRCRF